MGPGGARRKETNLAFGPLTFVIGGDEFSMRGRTGRLARSEGRLAAAVWRCRFNGRGCGMARFSNGPLVQLGPHISSAEPRILFEPGRSRRSRRLPQGQLHTRIDRLLRGW